MNPNHNLIMQSDACIQGKLALFVNTSVVDEVGTSYALHCDGRCFKKRIVCLNESFWEEFLVYCIRLSKVRHTMAIFLMF